MESPVALGKFKIVLFLPLLLFSFLSCKDLGVASFDFERDTPAWLKAKIDTMSTQLYYAGASVYRHEWRGRYVYHIENPISSCAFCELYDQQGNRMHFQSQEEFADYLHNRKDEVLVWQRRV